VQNLKEEKKRAKFSSPEEGGQSKGKVFLSVIKGFGGPHSMSTVI